MKLTAAWIGLLLATASGIVAAQEQPLVLSRTAAIPLPGVIGRIDHMAVDVPRKRLFVAALGNDSLEVIDLASGKRLQSLNGFKEPTGVAFVPKLDRVVVASGQDGMLRFLDGQRLHPLATIDKLPDADNVRYNPSTERVYVGWGDGALAVVDAQAMKLIGQIKLPAHPEAFAIEKRGSRIFVNVPAMKQIVVIDHKTLQVVAIWPITGAASNFPMALDETDHRLFVGCRRPATLLILDSKTGKTVTAVPCVGDADDLFYNAANKRIYVSGGEGAISIVEQRTPDQYRVMEKLTTMPRARTSLFAPDSKQLFLAVPAQSGRQAAIWVYQESVTRE